VRRAASLARRAVAIIACASLAVAFAACATLVTEAEPARHAPLDPLAIGELEDAIRILRSEQKLDENVALVSLQLEEPPKPEAGDRPPSSPPNDGRELASSSPPARVAFAVLHARPSNQTYEARIDLDRRRVIDWRMIPGAEPMMTADEFEIAADLVRADPRWRKAMGARGIDDVGEVYIDVWSPGELGRDDPRGVRLLRAIANLKGAQKNSYGPPIEGVVATVDMTHRTVASVADSGAAPMSRTSTDFYDPRVRGENRSPPGDLRLANPSATAIAIDGHEIRWQNWRMRWSLNAREGLVLHEIGCEDRGRLRSILYRASISEMWVPYGDSAASWTWRNAFDEGEYGLGSMANTLARGRDVPENALLFDAPFTTSGGEVLVQPAVVAAYERDGGIAWSHKDDSAGTEVRRATELVLAFVATAGNYDYGFRWVFHQDGTIAFEMDLTGILLTKGVEETQCQACRDESSDEDASFSVHGDDVESRSSRRDGAAPRAPNDGDLLPRVPRGDEAHGTLVADRVIAVNHQHFVSLRLDFDVDGAQNRVKEWNVRGESNARDNRGIVLEQTLFRTERDARRDASSAEHRTWEVYSSTAKNASGHATGYAIVPEENSSPYLGPSTRERELAGFVEHPFWATRYRARELYASGDYPSQGGAPGGASDGLAAWSADGESIRDQDVVVWYTLGVTHVPRPEDYPVMPVEHAGLKLVPHGFFDRNPALDVP
jgi:primary-amine oxidase